MIAIAKQEGSSVRVYDERGSFMFQKSGELQGYTSTTVSIKEGSSIRVYDEKGSFKFQR